jgi:cytochrome P450
MAMHVSKPSSPPSSSVEIAPAMREQIGDPGRPHAGLPANGKLDHLPGKVGLFSGFSNLVGRLRHGVDHMREQTARFGKVFRYPLGPMSIVVIADAETLSEITRNADRAWSAALAWRLLFEGIDPARVYSDGPGMVDFEPHKDIRRWLQPGFNSTALTGYIASTLELVGPAVDGWVAAGRVSFKEASRRLFATIANRVFLGVSDPQETATLDRAMAHFWRAPLSLVKSEWVSPTWRRARRGYTTLRGKLCADVAERRTSDRTDLFSILCRTGQEIGWIDDDIIAGFYLGVMAAAFDTTSAAVTSMAYALATHPEWQDKLVAEAKELPEQITADDLKKLELCDQAWCETLRRYPVAGDLPRRTLRDVEVLGHRIPAGAMVFVSIGTLHFDPEVWSEPDKWDPDRFSPARAEDRKKRGSYLPFGAGVHSCIGAQLSTMEAKAFWFSLLRRARIRLAKPYVARHEITPIGSVSGAVDLIVEPR